MRVLFDQAIPVPISTFLIGHTVRTGAQQRWDTLKNGELLTVAEEAGFEVFLTTGKNMRHQQNMAGRTIAIVVIGVQQWPALQPHVALVVAAVNAATPGSFTEVDIPLGSSAMADVTQCTQCCAAATMQRDPVRRMRSGWRCAAGDPRAIPLCEEHRPPLLMRLPAQGGSSRISSRSPATCPDGIDA